MAESALEAAAALGSESEAADASSKAAEAMALIGEHERALEIGRSLSYQFHRDRALTAVVAAWVRVGGFDQAERVAGEISKSGRPRSILVLIRGLLSSRSWDRAVEASGLIARYGRPALLQWVAYRLVNAGEWERGARTAERSLAEAGNNADAAAGALCAVAYARARAGDVDGALEAVQRWPVEHFGEWLDEAYNFRSTWWSTQQRLNALTIIANVVAEDGTYEAAMAILRLMQGAEGFADALRVVAEGLLKHGNVEGCKSFVELSLKVTAELDDLTSNEIKKLAVNLLGRAGDWERAVQVARAVDEAEETIKGQVCALAADGQWTDAETVLATMSPSYAKAEAQLEFVRCLARASEWDRAVVFARDIGRNADADDEDILRPTALSELALGLARTGRAEQALIVAETFLIAPQTRRRYRQVEAVADIAIQLGRKGKTACAIQLAERALGEARRRAPGHGDQLTCVATAFATAGSPHRAIEVIDELARGVDRSKALAAVAANLQAAQMHETSLELARRALAVAEADGDDFNAAVAESVIAPALATLGLADESLELIGRIRNTHKRLNAVRAATMALVAAGRAEELLSIAWGFKAADRADYRNAVREIAFAMAGGPDREGARALARKLNASDRREVLCAAARAFAHDRQSENARETAAQRGGGLLGVSDRPADQSSAEEAWGEEAADRDVEAVQHLRDAATRDARREWVAVRFAREGRFDHSLDLIRDIERPTANGTNTVMGILAPLFARAERVPELTSAFVAQHGTPATIRAMTEPLVAAGFLDDALFVWRAGLDRASAAISDDVFEMLAAGAPALAEIDNGETLWAVWEAASAVDDWWDH
jgi:tetratricopeptide (TPR) repeat protein